MDLQQILLESQVDSCESLIQDLNINKEEIKKMEEIIKACLAEIRPVNDDIKKYKAEKESYEQGLSAMETFKAAARKIARPNPIPEEEKIKSEMKEQLNLTITALKTKEAEAAVIIYKFQQHNENVSEKVLELLTNA